MILTAQVVHPLRGDPVSASAPTVPDVSTEHTQYTNSSMYALYQLAAFFCLLHAGAVLLQLLFGYTSQSTVNC